MIGLATVTTAAEITDPALPVSTASEPCSSTGWMTLCRTQPTPGGAPVVGEHRWPVILLPGGILPVGPA